MDRGSTQFRIGVFPAKSSSGGARLRAARRIFSAQGSDSMTSTARLDAFWMQVRMVSRPEDVPNAARPRAGSNESTRGARRPGG